MQPGVQADKLKFAREIIGNIIYALRLWHTLIDLNDLIILYKIRSQFIRSILKTERPQGTQELFLHLIHPLGMNSIL